MRYFEKFNWSVGLMFALALMIFIVLQDGYTGLSGAQVTYDYILVAIVVILNMFILISFYMIETIEETVWSIGFGVSIPMSIYLARLLVASKGLAAF